MRASATGMSGSINDDLLSYQQNAETRVIRVESPAWYAWLEDATSFSFKSSAGSFTAQKTRSGNGRGSWYWRAFRRQHGHLSSRYLGKSSLLSLERLNETARLLAEQATSNGANAQISGTRDASLAPAPTPTPAGNQHSRLLATKLHVPRLSEQHVPRPRLSAQLAWQTWQGLLLVSAPAGSGKTTLLSEWATTSALPVAWLALEPADNDPARFLAYLLAALQHLDQRIGQNIQVQAPIPYLPRAQPFTLEPLLIELVNDLVSHLAYDTALVLDDYHLIAAPAIHSMIEFLLDHLPARLRLVLGTRTDPPLPLARLRARGQLWEIRAEHLRFTRAEMGTFTQAMGHALSPEMLETLEQRTEGWIAGVQLLALALRGSKDPATFLHAFAGGHRFLLDYIEQEILVQQSAETGDFLLRTSLLERVCAPLCDAITSRNDGQVMLNELRQANLFISAIDDADRWYHYHALFAEALRTYMQRHTPDLAREVYQAASLWYEKQGDALTACEYALRASDFSRATHFLEMLVPALLQGAEFSQLRHLLDLLPAETFIASPQLGMAYLWILLPEDRVEQVQELAQRIGQALEQRKAEMERAEWAELHGQLTAFFATIAVNQNEPARAIELIQQALVTLSDHAVPPTSPAALHLHLILATAYRASGNPLAAEQVLHEIHKLSETQAQHFLQLIAIHDLDELYEARGRLHERERLWRHTLHVLSLQTKLAPFFASLASLSYARLLYEWNRLDEAEAYTRRAATGEPQRNQRATPDDMFDDSLLMQALIAHARNQPEKARALLQRLDALRPHKELHLASLRARFNLRSGNFAEALHWSQERALHIDDPFRDQSENLFISEYLTLARILIARGRLQPAEAFIEQAQTLLTRLFKLAETLGFTGWKIEILALRALASHAQVALPQALASLGEALALAEPEGYIRLFADEGEPMADLLTRVQAHTPASPAYLQTLLSAIAPADYAGEQAPGQASCLLDPLSQREMEVLRLLAGGATNQQIADQLIITLNTTKSHVKHILAKLAATNRTQAIRHARELGLL